MRYGWFAFILLTVGGIPALAVDDVLVADFEGADYAGWEVTGDAFGSGPAHGSLPKQLPVAGFQGQGLVNSYLNGDASQGMLTSPSFTIQRPFINFLIGGGDHPEQTCIELIVDDKTVRTCTGADFETLEWVTWDVHEWEGRSARIRIIDRATGGWGHICVDQIVQSRRRQAPEYDTSSLYHETYRPQFHFTAAKDWINDPNGLVYHDGEYHMFFQRTPGSLYSGDKVWGHAVSRNLIHWRQLSDAILSDNSGSIWSGSAVIDWNNTAGFQRGTEKTLVAIYTAAGGMTAASAGQPFTQRIAYSNDRGRTMTKYAGNPVLGPISSENRDPKVAWFAPTKSWVMALFITGSKYALLTSPDLKKWTPLQELMFPPNVGECPDFFEMPIDGEEGQKRWVFTSASGQYFVGSFDGKEFKPETGPHRSDWGRNFYAVQTFSDIPASDGRRIQIAWMNDGRYPRMPFNQQMSFPCELRLRRTTEGLRIFKQPVREIEKLRRGKHNWSDVTLQAGDNPLSEIHGELFDISAQIETDKAEEVTWMIRGQPIRYTPSNHQLSCLDRSVDVNTDGKTLQFRILVDRTSLEVFVQGGERTLSSCFLPAYDDLSLALSTKGGTVVVKSMEVYELGSAWPKAESLQDSRPSDN